MLARPKRADQTTGPASEGRLASARACPPYPICTGDCLLPAMRAPFALGEDEIGLITDIIVRGLAPRVVAITPALCGALTNTRCISRVFDFAVRRHPLFRIMALAVAGDGRSRRVPEGEHSGLYDCETPHRSGLGGLELVDIRASEDGTLEPEVIREISVSSAVDHPHVRSFQCAVLHPRGSALFVEPVKTTLAALVHGPAGGAVPAGLLRSIMAQLLTALSALHARGVVHGNVAPHRVLLRGKDEVLLGDFFFSPAPSPVVSLARPSRAAPEARSFPRSYGAPNDVWACGAIMLEAATGCARWKRVRAECLGERELSGLAPCFADAGARGLLLGLLRADPAVRLSAAQAASHPWLTHESPPRPIRRLSLEIDERPARADNVPPVSRQRLRLLILWALTLCETMRLARRVAWLLVRHVSWIALSERGRWKTLALATINCILKHEHLSMLASDDLREVASGDICALDMFCAEAEVLSHTAGRLHFPEVYTQEEDSRCFLLAIAIRVCEPSFPDDAAFLIAGVITTALDPAAEGGASALASLEDDTLARVEYVCETFRRQQDLLDLIQVRLCRATDAAPLPFADEWLVLVDACVAVRSGRLTAP